VTSAPPTSISATAVVVAPPTLLDVLAPGLPEPTSGPGSGSSHKSGWGKKVKPPSMVLDDDVNGFRGNPKRKGGGGKKNKKVRVITLLPDFTQLISSRIRMYSN
jgi:splicing factor 45